MTVVQSSKKVRDWNVAIIDKKSLGKIDDILETVHEILI